MSSDYKDRNSRPIQAQPEGQLYNQNQLSRTSAIVPPGLEALVEVKEVVLKKRVFQTRRGQVLFSICKDSECCGPPINIWLRDSRKREVIKVYLAPYDGCCSNYSYLQIDVPYRHPIGFVKSSNTIGIQKFSIQNANQEPVFTAVCDDPIQVPSSD
ncbi:phospholipid scramblase 3-like [Discoglossus pictus]